MKKNGGMKRGKKDGKEKNEDANPDMAGQDREEGLANRKGGEKGLKLNWCHRGGVREKG